MRLTAVSARAARWKGTTLSCVSSPTACKRGFTLLEITLVALIMAMLASVFLPSWVEKSRNEVAESYARELNLLVETLRKYYSVYQNFPARLGDLTSRRFIPQIPSDPFGGTLTYRRGSFSSGGVTVPYADLIITGGIANTPWRGIVLSRVPFAVQSGNRIIIRLTAVQAFSDREVVYVGIHYNGDVVTAFQCPAGTRRYVVVMPVSVYSGDDTALVAYRTRAVPISSTAYRIECVAVSEGGISRYCAAAVQQFCR